MLDPNQEKIDKLEKELARANAAIAKLQSSSTSSVPQTPAGGSFDVNKILNLLQNPLAASASVIGSNIPFNEETMGSFFTDIMTNFNKMEDAVTNLAMKFGGARGQAEGIKKTIDLATPSVIALGGTMDDVVNIQKGVIDGLQRQVILDKDSYAQLYAIGNLINDGSKTSAESTKNLVTQFKNLGYSIYDITGQMGGIINMARDMGVSVSAVYKQLSDNVEKLNLYNFDGGIKGMAKMAAEAASLRLNMSDTFNFAEKVFKPEQALEMAAGMQRLGVGVSSLLDPFKLMDMAQNKPEELQKSLMEAAKEFVRFDEAQGKFIVTDQRRIREYADLLNVSAEKVAQMGMNFADMERKMSTIDFGTLIPEEDKKFFAGLAELNNGKYMVNVGVSDDGKPILKEIKDLKQEDIDLVRRQEEEKKKTPVELQLEANHILQNVLNSIDAMRGVTSRQIAASGTLDKFTRKAGEAGMQMLKGTQKELGITTVGGVMDITGLQTKVNKAGDTFKEAITSFIEDPKKGINTVLNGLTSAIFNGGETITSAFETIKNVGTKILKNADEEAERGKKTGEYKEEPIKFSEIPDNLVSFFNNLFNLGTTSATGAATQTGNNVAAGSSMTPIQGSSANTAAAAQTGVSLQSLSNSTPNSFSDLVSGITAGLKEVFKKYERSPSLGVTLDKDNSGLISKVSQTAEKSSTVMDKNMTDLKNSVENKEEITTPIQISKPTELTENKPTSSNITNYSYSDVVNAISKGKTPEFLQNQINQSSITNIKPETPGYLAGQTGLFEPIKKEQTGLSKSMENIYNVTNTTLSNLEKKYATTNLTTSPEISLKTPGYLAGQTGLFEPIKKEQMGLSESMKNIYNVTNTSLSNLEKKYATTNLTTSPEISLKTPGYLANQTGLFEPIKKEQTGLSESMKNIYNVTNTSLSNLEKKYATTNLTTSPEISLKTPGYLAGQTGLFEPIKKEQTVLSKLGDVSSSKYLPKTTVSPIMAYSNMPKNQVLPEYKKLGDDKGGKISHEFNKIDGELKIKLEGDGNVDALLPQLEILLRNPENGISKLIKKSLMDSTNDLHGQMGSGQSPRWRA